MYQDINVVEILRAEDILNRIKDRPDAAQVMGEIAKFDDQLRRKSLEAAELSHKLRYEDAGESTLDRASTLGSEIARLEDERRVFVENLFHE